MAIDLAVVPVAGRGTRLLPLTKSQPKEMLPVGRKPVVQYVVEELHRCGIRRLLFVTGPGKTAIENHFDIDAELIATLRETGKEELLGELAFEREDVDYFYTRQRRQLGLGHAVLCARPFIGRENFVVALGDSIIGLNAESRIVQQMIEQFETSVADAVIAFEEVPPEEVVHYGIAAPRGKAGEVFVLDDLVEKPGVDEAPSNLAVAARYVFSPAIFDCLERTPPGKGGRNPTDRRDPAADRGRAKGARRAAAAGRRTLRHRQFRELLRGLRGVRPGRPALRGRPAGARAALARTGGRGGAMLIIRRTAFARAGLVGNPSDGYHGKTISVIVRNFSARVTLYEWDQLEVVPSQEDQSRFRSVDELVRDVTLHGYYGGDPAGQGDDQEVRRVLPGPEPAAARANFSVRYESNIPRQVGLAGSSAIIVATLRCLMEFYGVEIPLQVQPSLALSVENEELGIAAGLQDRVIQVYEGLVFMDFARDRMQTVCNFDCGRYEPLDPGLLPPLYLAYTAEEAEPTEVFHNNLRARYEAGRAGGGRGDEPFCRTRPARPARRWPRGMRTV